MEIFEDDLTYMALRGCVDDVIKVYVDSSFNRGSTGRSIGEQSETAGTGWTMATSNGRLAGFGMNSLVDAPSASSELWELRGIISFFNTLKRNRPDLLNRDQTFEIHCDNLSVIEYLNKTHKGSFIKRVGKQHVKLLQEFQVATNITFHWVKGHAGHYFNSMADRFAWRASTLLDSDSMNYYKRQLSINTILSTRGIHWADEVLTIPAPERVKGMGAGSSSEIRAAYKARHRKTKEEQQAEAELWRDTSFMEVIAEASDCGSLTKVTATHESGSTFCMNVDTPGYGKTARALAAINAVLESCWKTGIVDHSRTLTLYGNCNQAAAPVNTIRKGKDPDPLKYIIDKNIAKEMSRMHRVMTGKTVRYLDVAAMHQIKATA